MWRRGVLPYPGRRPWPEGCSTRSRAWPSSTTAEWRQAAATGCLPEDAGLSSWRWTRSPRFTLSGSRDRNQLLCAKKRYTCTRQMNTNWSFLRTRRRAVKRHDGAVLAGLVPVPLAVAARLWHGAAVPEDRWGWVAQVSGCCSAMIAVAAAGVMTQPELASDCYPRAQKVGRRHRRAHLSRMHAPFATVHLQLLKGTVGISISAKICRSKIYALRPNLMLASFLTWIINVASFKMQTATFTTLHSREHSATCTDCVQCTRIQHWQRTNRAVGN